MQKRVSEVEAALLRKGFRESASKDRRFIFFRSDGRKSIVSTMISHGERELDDWHLRQMARQMRLTLLQLDEFVSCTMTRESYEDIVKAAT